MKLCVSLEVANCDLKFYPLEFMFSHDPEYPVNPASPACPVKSLRVIYPGLNLLFFIKTGAKTPGVHYHPPPPPPPPPPPDEPPPPPPELDPGGEEDEEMAEEKDDPRLFAMPDAPILCQFPPIYQDGE